jgi:hypothetical protein
MTSFSDGMYIHTDREILNLVIDGTVIERFVVTKTSWLKFLKKLDETPSIRRDETRSMHHAIPSQL